MNEFDKILDKNEKILWEGKPEFLPFVFNMNLGVLILGIILVMSGLVVIFYGLFLGEYLYFIAPQFWLGLVIIFSPMVYRIFLLRHTHYAITNKRVIIQTGIIGRDFGFVDFDQITSAIVNIGFIDKTLGKDSGTIIISTAGNFSLGMYKDNKGYLSNISDPYTVFKFFKKVSFDVKTDIKFPNQYRPKKNPGAKV